jgi:hypothetical protein
MHPKIAALFYDRLWAGITIWEPDAPVELLYWPPSSRFLPSFAGALLFEPPGADQRNSFITSHGRMEFERNLRREARECEKAAARPVPVMFQSKLAFEEQLQFTDTSNPVTTQASQAATSDHLLMTLDNVDLLDERALEWDQILEVRSDRAARRKIKRLFNWFESETTANFDAIKIRETLADRLEEYRDAIKKHGLGTKLGLAQIVYALGSSSGIKLLLEGSWHTTLPLTPFAVVGTTLGIAKVMYDRDQALDKLEKDFAEVALLHMLKS